MRKQVNENGNTMWGMLTAESFQPILEFDFLGPDSWAALGKSEAAVAALPAGDKLELRTRQVRHEQHPQLLNNLIGTSGTAPGTYPAVQPVHVPCTSGDISM